ncbi:MAG: beta-1,3-glucanase family protein [Eubacterium sp.]
MKRTKKILAFVLAFVLTITLLPMCQTSAAKKTKLNKTKATVYVGKTLKLKVKNKHTNKKVKWKSTNKKVATVSKKGKVKGKRPGKATIIAKVGKKKYKCKITVKKKQTNNNQGQVEKPAGTTSNVVPNVSPETKPSQEQQSTKKSEQEQTQPAPQQTTPKPTEKTTQKQEETTTSMSFTTDVSIDQPFGLVVSSPEEGMVNVVWGAGKINCYNLYIDGERRRTGVKAASYTLPVYSEGTHTIAVTTVVGNRESVKIEMTIAVVGVGERETEPETCPEELKPQLRNDIPLKEDRILLQLNNKTDGQYDDNQIYWCIVGYNTSHQLCYLDANGNLIPANTNLNNIKINNRDVANVCHNLTEASYVYAPSIESGRMYVSYGKPIYLTFIQAADGNMGYAGPDLNNASDPNIDTLFEFAEFTIDGKFYWGNTTRVDFFSFPMITRLVGHTQYETYDKTVGDIGTRDEIFAAFKNNAPDPFKTLVDNKRIMAPCKTTFNEGQQYGNYFDSYINEFWNKYSNEDLVFQCEGGTFTGHVEGNRMKFTRSGDSTAYYVNKPTTQDVLEGKGAFNNGNATEKVIEAQLCAAFNRGVATEPSKWTKPTEYYKNSINNYYAGFFHQHSVVGLAYGFCYDDVNDQSTLLQYDNADALVIDLRW